MGELRDRMDEDMRLKGLSPATRRNYLIYCRKFAAFFNKSPAELGESEVREFLLYQVQGDRVARVTYRQMRAALKFLYSVTLQRSGEFERIPPPRREPPKLRQILDHQQVVTLLNGFRNPKYRVLFMCCYGAGLRISEACYLEVSDIDSRQMVIRVRDGKGGRDRYTVLSPRLLDMLRDYWRIYRPPVFLFPGQSLSGCLSPDSVRQVFRKTCDEVGIGRWCTPHTLRHCFASHLLESGLDIEIVRNLLGHKSIKTTSLYTHLTATIISRAPSPLDKLPPISLEVEERS